MKNKDIFLLLGTNLGDRSANLSIAASKINQFFGEVVLKSSVLETEPWGFSAPEKFLNQALQIETNLNPFELLSKIKEIEHEMGRKVKKMEGYESRIIDIDILFFGQQIINDPSLIIPHPQLQNRYFALKPLSELASEYRHPILKKNVETLLKENVQFK